jgi:hypothetical protein
MRHVTSRAVKPLRIREAVLLLCLAIGASYAADSHSARESVTQGQGRAEGVQVAQS